MYKKSNRRSHSEISFNDLIEAAKSLKQISPDLSDNLHKLRDERNTTHLGLQIERKRKNRFQFSVADLDRAGKKDN